MVALEPATQQNGCLKLLAGTQAMGRIDHSLLGQQQSAEEDRVSAAMERHALVHAEMEAGDVSGAMGDRSVAVSFFSPGIPFHDPLFMIDLTRSWLCPQVIFFHALTLQ